MFPRRKRNSLTRASVSRSRSATPSEMNTTQRPSTARRALLMGLATSMERRSPECEQSVPRGGQRALCVNTTPGGSLRVTGEVPVLKTPGGHVRRQDLADPPLCSNVLERVEDIDLSEEEADELMMTAPWHVRRWFQTQQGRECDNPQPLSSSAPIDAHVDSPSRIASVPGPSKASAGIICDASIDADVRPSSSRAAATSKPAAREENPGSDLDSEFDDEFDTELDIAPIQVNAGRAAGRDIPDDEELERPVRDIIHNVEREMDEEIDRLLGESTSFEWVEDFESFRGVPEVFSGPSPGPLRDYDTPYDAFTDIWTKDIIELIARETNRYAKQTIDSMKVKGTLKPSSRLHQWYDTDPDEIMVLFAVFMYMAIDPRKTLKEYWMTDNVLEMPRFRELMSYNRFVLLSKFLHFVDNENLQNLDVELDPKLAKIAPVITHLNQKFSSLYNLAKEISIDESLTLFKGRLSWVQTIRSKAARFGIKSFELCESKTGYLYNFSIYTGKNSQDGGSANVSSSAAMGSKSAKIVLDLLKGLERRGHCVTMDNYYNSPALARFLKSRGFDCLGTLRRNRKNVPPAIAKAPQNVAKGTIIARHCGDVSITAWKDSKLVTMISTYHTAETYTGSKAGKPLVKPISVRDYNGTMGGVDLMDQKLSMYLLERKRALKWYMKIFKRLMNVSIHNAFVMYVNSRKRRDMHLMTHREFRYELADSLVQRHRRPVPQNNVRVAGLMRLRNDIVHQPSYETGRNNRKRCVVCFRQGKSKQVHSQCVTCGEYLCFEGCWREWHSLPKLKGESRGRKRRRNSNDDV